MDINMGDLIATLPAVSKIQAVINLKGGEMGIVVETGPVDTDLKVYGVMIDGHLYYLFEDEIEKLEAKC